jgi:hypothetical protein
MLSANILNFVWFGLLCLGCPSNSEAIKPWYPDRNQGAGFCIFCREENIYFLTRLDKCIKMLMFVKREKRVP